MGQNVDFTTTEGLAIEQTLKIISGKFKCIILWHLNDGPAAFGELKKKIKTVPDRTLTSQLRRLEADGLVGRKKSQDCKIRIKYFLTDAGKALQPVLLLMHRWAAENISIYHNDISRTCTLVFISK